MEQGEQGGQKGQKEEDGSGGGWGRHSHSWPDPRADSECTDEGNVMQAGEEYGLWWFRQLENLGRVRQGALENWGFLLDKHGKPGTMMRHLVSDLSKYEMAAFVSWVRLTNTGFAPGLAENGSLQPDASDWMGGGVPPPPAAKERAAKDVEEEEEEEEEEEPPRTGVQFINVTTLRAAT